MPRVILIVMDGCGVGALPDASEYGATDAFSNTLGHISQFRALNLPNLRRMGLGNITVMPGIQPFKNTLGGWGKCAELSKGKDSVTGHWEMMGIVTQTAFPTYPHGFPPDIITQFESAIGCKTLGNYPASGTEIIKDLGQIHVETGFPIVYTSADSVFQVAAHEEIVTLQKLYDICAAARELLKEPNNVQRIIARPFSGDAEHGFLRTTNRRDFPLPPPEPNVLTILRNYGIKTHAIGVISELFPKSYFASFERTQTNTQHLDAIKKAMDSDESDFIFANCEDFDMLYGHRNDPSGFAESLEAFDQGLGEILDKLAQGDLLIITADHGNDPTTASTDHSREFVPLLTAAHAILPGTELGIVHSMASIGGLVCRALNVAVDFE